MTEEQDTQAGARSSDVLRSKSEITYSYATIKITQSRIDKGLIAVPVSLAGWFPDHNDTLEVYLNDSPFSQIKQYSSYNSSTRECRIGGMREWFQQNNIKSGDEVVIQLIDREHLIYRLIPERNFVSKTRELQSNLDISETEREASERITTLAQWTHSDKDTVALNEYYRLTGSSLVQARRYVEKIPIRTRETVPANLRTLLESLYKGHCQLCDFWFLKRDQKPYFEVHHLNPLQDHHPRNLLVVCGNCHNQYEHANVEEVFNGDKWLIRVSFNQKIYPVNHILLRRKAEGFFKQLFI